RSCSWPGGPWRTTLEPIGRPPWTIASNPGTPVGSRGVESLLQRTRQAGSEREIGMSADRVSKCRLEDSFRGIRSQSLRADVPEVPMDSRDEFPEAVQPRLAPVDHLFDDGLPLPLLVSAEAMLLLDLAGWRSVVPEACAVL